jgi:predicted RNase H-like HicB family nuclease
MDYPVFVEQDEEGYYIVSCPTFKACHADGETLDEALENLKQVIKLCQRVESKEELGTNKFIEFKMLQIA